MTVFKIIADSNIFVAYALCTDIWHFKSKKIFKADTIYCSKHIVDEFEKVIKNRVNETNKLIELINFNLMGSSKSFNSLKNLYNFVSKLDNINLFEKNLNIKHILKVICERVFKLKFPINSFGLYTAFETFNANFKYEIKNRKSNMYNQTIIFENHSKDYSLNVIGIEKLFHGKNKGGDYEIIHDVCEYVELSKNSTVDSKFCFVTSDDEFYNGIKSILNEIPLDSIKHLKNMK